MNTRQQAHTYTWNPLQPLQGKSCRPWSCFAGLAVWTSIAFHAAGPVPAAAGIVFAKKLQPVPTSAAYCRSAESLSLLSSTYNAHSPLNIDLPLRAQPFFEAKNHTLHRSPGLGFTAKPTPPTHRVEGRIRFNYIRRSADILASVGEPNFPQYAHKMESVETRTVRRAKIVLEDDQGHYIQGKLNENGEFTFSWIPAIGFNGRVTVWTVSHHGSRNAAVGFWSGGNITHTDELTNEPGDYSPYSFTQTFNLSNAQIATGGLFLDIVIPETDESAPAFWMLENGLIALDYYLDINGVNFMPKLNIAYSPNLTLEGGETAFYSPGKDPGFIYMPPAFGWVDFALRHEVAHCFQRHYLRDCEYKRMGEPLANAHALAMIGSPWMDKPGTQTFECLDVQANFVDEAFRLEDSQGDYWTYCDGCEDLNYSYGWIQRALWDLVDGDEQNDPEILSNWFPYQSDSEVNAGEFDLIDGGGATSIGGSDHVLNDVLVHYLGGGVWGVENPAYQDRGAEGVDLVDVLDGMICRGYATVEQVDRLINHAMEFGYQAAGPGSCD